eukprot:XP_008646782.1 keratin-associated protein 5-3-like [Zea mays]
MRFSRDQTREVAAATEPSRLRCCSDSDRGSDGCMLLVEESSGVLDDCGGSRGEGRDAGRGGDGANAGVCAGEGSRAGMQNRGAGVRQLRADFAGLGEAACGRSCGGCSRCGNCGGVWAPRGRAADGGPCGTG